MIRGMVGWIWGFDTWYGRVNIGLGTWYGRVDMLWFAWVDDQQRRRYDRINQLSYRGTSLARKCTPLGPYRRPMPRVLGGAQGGGRYLMNEVPLYGKISWLAADCDRARNRPAIRTAGQRESLLPPAACNPEPAT